jgi:hypothetical protein
VVSYLVSHQQKLETVCAKLVAAGAPQLPLWRAVADRRIALIHIIGPEAAWPSATLERLPMPLVVLVGADMGAGNDAPPDKWQCARRLKYWCRAAIIHGAGGKPEHYRIAVAAAEACRRVALIETTSEQAPSWKALIGCPRTLLILPREGEHPRTPAREVVQ